MISILFILSYIFIIYTFIRIKKTNKKLNILLWITISIITYMGYNSIIIYLLSIINIKSTLLLRSIINIIIAIIMLIISKKKQEYYFDYLDFGIIIMIFYLSLIIFIYRFGFDFKLDFDMNDAAVHFSFAKTFANNNILINSNIKNIVYNFGSNNMYFSYTNAGTLLQILKPLTGTIGMYKSFIIFEMLSYMFGGIILYFIIRKDKISNFKYIFTILLITLYLIGYPFTNLLYGFHYWGLTILVIGTIIIILKELDDNKMYNNKLIILMLFILSISVFITYYLYVPIVYLSIGLYFIYLCFIKKEITFKKLIIYFVIILIVPFIYGLLHYNIIEGYFHKAATETKMNIDGSNYKNLIGNFIFMLPLVIYGIIKEFQKRKINFITILTIINFIYTIILFILCLKGIMSNYYYGKIYNLSWLIMFIYIIKILYEEKDLIYKIYIISYIIISILAMVKIEDKINRWKKDISSNTVINNLGDIYKNNITIFSKKEKLINSDIYDLLKEVKNNYNTYKNARGEVPFITSYFRKIWIAQILDIMPSNNYHQLGEFWANAIKYITEDEGVEYIVWIVDKENTDYIYYKDKYDIVYENNAGYILKKKTT